MSFVAALRRATAADHAAVDAAFGAFRLTDVDDYARFLTAHARALGAIEAVLAGAPALPAWRQRLPLLAADLAALDQPLPVPIHWAPDDPAARWGALYVIEGSRLGGQLLARRVPPSLPRAYLGAVHRPGEWRALLHAIEVQATASDAAWRGAAIAGARQTFALYAGAVR
ncbi:MULTISPECIES: biliverdin-producing heme oxygenase [unclassified Sphingomonas]|uniref:biliverdin-producing heme oxygenase n=1 Tax=unclassified Sphingomonas TaxID=196159 RepID=UPI000E1007C4|nr:MULTISPECIES: biliverdin-producing heme oxygenase [unclassified Sphingomonas]AXJ96784.1 hypothetical protein DM480_01690 [Sphingomonas sp. FARSPH]